MRTVTWLTLTEYRTREAVPLSRSQRDALLRAYPRIGMKPTVGFEDRYDLTPDQRIGLISLPGLTIEIRPKAPISNVVFLLSYACGAAKPDTEEPELSQEHGLVELIALLLSGMVERATRRGLLTGYITEEDSLQAPRGRILFDSQIRRRLGLAPPVEVRHDVFTPDVLENQLLLAALDRLGQLRLRSPRVRKELNRARRVFGAVSACRFSPSHVPDIVFTRLNGHYRPAVTLASLVLRSISAQLGSGSSHASAFLIDMNTVFEQFVRIALREALGASRQSFPDEAPKLYLDVSEQVRLRPDLCLIDRDRIAWVGDAKYKRLPSGKFRHADLYQMLAYTTALSLDEGTLIYAADAGVHTRNYPIAGTSKTVRIAAVDLDAPPKAILGQLSDLAMQIETASL